MESELAEIEELTHGLAVAHAVQSECSVAQLDEVRDLVAPA